MGSVVWLQKARGPLSLGLQCVLRWVWCQSETCPLYRSGKLTELQVSDLLGMKRL